MANSITLTRFLLLFVLVASAMGAPAEWQLLNPPLLLLIIGLDGLDGWVARRRGESSVFGAMFDIIVDRVVENVLWIVLSHVGLVPLWVTLVFITRGIIVDSIRYSAVAQGATPFGMMRSRWGRFLVAGRFMRGFYGTLKAVAFAWMFAVQPLPALAPELWADWGGALAVAGMLLVHLAVAVCLARGLPVVAEWLAAERIIRVPDALE